MESAFWDLWKWLCVNSYNICLMEVLKVWFWQLLLILKACQWEFEGVLGVKQDEAITWTQLTLFHKGENIHLKNYLFFFPRIITECVAALSFGFTEALWSFGNMPNTALYYREQLRPQGEFREEVPNGFLSSFFSKCQSQILSCQNKQTNRQNKTEKEKKKEAVFFAIWIKKSHNKLKWPVLQWP